MPTITASQRSRKFHSPLHPDIMDLDKNDDEGQPVTVKGFLMWNISALRDEGSTYPYGYLRSIPTHHPFLSKSFLPYFCQSVISSFKISCTVSIPSLTVTANSSLPKQNKKTKVQLHINEHEDAFKHIR